MQISMTPEQRQSAKREVVQQVEQGATASEARMRSPVSMHRTTVYRLLKRVQREGEDAFNDGRHGHPVKLRGEILTFLTDYCQSHFSASSAEVQHLLGLRRSQRRIRLKRCCSWCRQSMLCSSRQSSQFPRKKWWNLRKHWRRAMTSHPPGHIHGKSRSPLVKSA